MTKRLHIGTSGWSYNHWSGTFYPEGMKPSRYLEFYITQFNCVELNASFYRLPSIKTVESWARRTPPSFRFCVKMNRFITHRKRLIDIAEPLERYLTVFKPLSDRLGPHLVQLPPSLRFDSHVVEAFLELLGSHRKRADFALEARHESWFQPDALSVLRKYDIAGVLADSGGNFPGTERCISSTVYLRFHGPRGLYYSRYSIDELSVYARKIVKWLAEDRDVWIFFNNDVHGHAIHNAYELEELVKSIYS